MARPLCEVSLVATLLFDEAGVCKRVAAAPAAQYGVRVDIEAAKQILAALERERVRYVVVGSMAMALQGLIRATRDMDFFVAPDRDNVDRLKVALKSVFADPSLDEISADDLGGDYPAIQYISPDAKTFLDILSRLGEAFSFDDVDKDAHDVDIAGIRVRVATPRMLYRMKKDTVRPQDRLDAAALRARFDLEDE